MQANYGTCISHTRTKRERNSCILYHITQKYESISSNRETICQGSSGRNQTSSRTIVTLKSDNKVENENNESNTRNEEPLQEETTNEFGRTSEEILEQPKPKLKIKKSSSSKSKN